MTIEVIARPIEQWRSGVFTTAELNDPAISGPLADPDRDGRANVVEYLAGSAPKLADSDPTGLIQAEVVGGRLQIRWTERTFAPDVIAIPERADKVDGPWFSAPELFERTETELSGFRQITVRDTIPVAGRSAGFMRLRFEVR